MEAFYHPSCSKLFFGSLALVVATIVSDCYFSILPFNGIYLFLYLVVVSLISIWITFAFVQRILKTSKPFECSLQDAPYLQTLMQLYKSPAKEQTEHDSVTSGETDRKKDIEERVKDFAADIEKYYIAKWYMKVSTDDTFRLESRVLIEDVTRRFLQVVVMVDGKKVLHGVLVILLKHLKEYRKAVKRLQKNGGTIEDMYRYSHIGSKSTKAQDYYIQQLTTNLLRQFINWELWNSLPCRTLVSIVSRKVLNYALVYISKPGFINYRILNALASEQTKKSLQLDDYKFVSLSTRKSETKVEKVTADINLKHLSDTIDSANTPKDSPKRNGTKMHSDVINGQKKNVEMEDKKDDVVDSIKNTISNDLLTENVANNRATSQPVKIYESKSANKTWRNSSDLECVSLGQDILTNLSDCNDPDSEIQSFIEKKLWKDANDLMEQNEKTEESATEDLSNASESKTSSPPTGLPTFLKPATTGAATLITNTIKPIGNVTASIFQQSTVDTVNNVVKPVSQATSNAMHKIGDLQDEAAGVMEGIFDFGMAGLRKGLRLTGLQNNLSEAAHRTKHEFQKATVGKKASDSTKTEQKPLDAPKAMFEKVSKGAVRLGRWTPVASDDLSLEQVEGGDDTVWVNPLSPSFEGEILLERTPLEPEKSLPADLDSAKENKLKSYDIPQISTDSEHVESPDPEYEEPADFASTIAKLRCLLQQKSSESSLTTPAVSPMPPDDMSFKTTPVESSNDITEVDGVMPSLYKFCARTATGVFQNTLNTIKTALPGNVPEHVQQSLIQDNVDQWTYVASDLSNEDMLSRIQKLLAERREFCTVDTAYEAIDSLNIEEQPDEAWAETLVPYDDELDDFELKVPVSKALLDVLCELVVDTNSSLVQESVVKSVLLLVGGSSEKYFETKSDKVVRNVNTLIGHIPAGLNQEVKAMKLEEMVGVCVGSCPGVLRQLLGETTVQSSLQFLISSLQCQKINQDIFLQIFELMAYQLIQANSQMTPAFSA